MGITNNIPPSRLIQPGVVDNTAARPVSPFEGQCIFQKDTDQLLVWNGSAWVVPNSPTQNPTGLEYVAGATFTNVASFDMTGFSSTYDFYQFQTRMTGTAGNLTAACYQGATQRTGYYGASWYNTYQGTNGNYTTAGNSNSFAVTAFTGTIASLVNGTISGVANNTFNMTLQAFDTNITAQVSGAFNNYSGNSSFDRIRFSGTNNITGNWVLLGVRK